MVTERRLIAWFAWAATVAALSEGVQDDLPRGGAPPPAGAIAGTARVVSISATGAKGFGFDKRVLVDIPDSRKDGGRMSASDAFAQSKVDIVYDFRKGIPILWLSADRRGAGPLSNVDLRGQLTRGVAVSLRRQRFSGVAEVSVGRRFALRTTDGKYACIRVEDVDERALVVDWIFQTDGTDSFPMANEEFASWCVPSFACGGRSQFGFPVAVGRGMFPAPVCQCDTDGEIVLR